MTIAAEEQTTRDRAVFTITSHRKNGTVDRTYRMTELALVKLLAVVFGAVLIVGVGGDQIDRSFKRHAADAIKPQMQALADNGRDDATMWLAKNYADARNERIASLAAKGNAEAMYLQSLTSAQDDKEVSMQWLRKAAAAGYAPAVQYLKQRM